VLDSLGDTLNGAEKFHAHYFLSSGTAAGVLIAIAARRNAGCFGLVFAPGRYGEFLLDFTRRLQSVESATAFFTELTVPGKTPGGDSKPGPCAP